mmetsp:Transcript_83901/g.153892  ORF Transcript_83901/g.153892 Transcript_83901/m.153892 type:complete len:84 (-) Transcript_83901:707-958(-)
MHECMQSGSGILLGRPSLCASPLHAVQVNYCNPNPRSTHLQFIVATCQPDQNSSQNFAAQYLKVARRTATSASSTSVTLVQTP